MEIKLTDYDVQQMCERAIRDQLHTALQSSTSPLKQRFHTALVKAVDEMGPAIELAVRRGMQDALLSPEFHRMLQAGVLQACNDKFGGAMTAIMKAAAKRVATDTELQQRMESAVVAASHPTPESK